MDPWYKVAVPRREVREGLKVTIEFTVRIDSAMASNTEAELQQILAELGVADRLSLARC